MSLKPRDIAHSDGAMIAVLSEWRGGYVLVAPLEHNTIKAKKGITIKQDSDLTVVGTISEELRMRGCLEFFECLEGC